MRERHVGQASGEQSRGLRAGGAGGAPALWGGPRRRSVLSGSRSSFPADREEEGGLSAPRRRPHPSAAGGASGTCRVPRRPPREPRPPPCDGPVQRAAAGGGGRRLATQRSQSLEGEGGGGDGTQGLSLICNIKDLGESRGHCSRIRTSCSPFLSLDDTT